MTRSYGRAKKNKRAISTKPISKVKLLTLIGAMSLNGIIVFINTEPYSQ